MKIVILEKEEALGIGGIVMHNTRLADYLKKTGHTVSIIRFSNNKKRERNVFYIPYHIAERRTFIFVPSEKTDNLLRKYLRKIKPDIVHFCLGISPFDLFIPNICHDLKIPVVGIIHGDIGKGNSAYNFIGKSVFLAFIPILNQLDSFIVFSEESRKFFIKHGINSKKIQVIPNGVDTNLYSPGASQFYIKHNLKKCVVFVGRMTKIKNPEVLIKSFLEINPNKNTKLVLVGTGDLEKELKEMYGDDRIIFTGLIKDEEKKIDILRSCQIFVLPSGYEGMSLALLEAMSSGLACIATDVGAHPELLKNAGIVIPHNNLSHGLPMALNMLLENPWLVAEFGKRARKKILKSYSNETIMPKYVELYQETVAGFQKNGYQKTSPIDLASPIIKRLEKFWKQAKKLSSDYLFTL